MALLEGRTRVVQGGLGSCWCRCQVRATHLGLPCQSHISFSDALRLNPNSPDALSLRGLVLFLGGRLPQALQHVMSALRLDPGHEPAQKLRKRVKDVEKIKEDGNVAFKTGRLQEAYDRYSECLEVRPDPSFVAYLSNFISSVSGTRKKKAGVAKFELHCFQTVLRRCSRRVP